MCSELVLWCRGVVVGLWWTRRVEKINNGYASRDVDGVVDGCEVGRVKTSERRCGRRGIVGKRGGAAEVTRRRW